MEKSFVPKKEFTPEMEFDPNIRHHLPDTPPNSLLYRGLGWMEPPRKDP